MQAHGARHAAIAIDAHAGDGRRNREPTHRSLARRSHIKLANPIFREI